MSESDIEPTDVEKPAPAKKAPPKKKVEEKPDYTKGKVDLAELRIMRKDSDSVRRLQTALGTNVTGDFDGGTQRALRDWQSRNGFAGGRGIAVNEPQAKRLFGDGYDVS